ncbi:MAG: hypothetical protein JXB03_04655 [Spirochaetales bacterium]|nr:hypothetical protein [Spirochaetales bacterium]
MKTVRDWGTVRKERLRHILRDDQHLHILFHDTLGHEPAACDDDGEASESPDSSSSCQTISETLEERFSRWVDAVDC